MYGYLLEDWLTVRSSDPSAIIIQSEAKWFNADPFGDLVFWLEVSDVVLGGGTAVVMLYATSPSKDNVLTAAMGVSVMTPSAAPTIVKITTGVAAVRPSVWVRWMIRALGPVTEEWGTTFRLHCAANVRAT